MTVGREDLKHMLPANHAVFFVLSHELTRDEFEGIIRVLEDNGGRRDTSATPAEHWVALRERREGTKRWDTVVPRYTGGFETREDGQKRRASFHNLQNILANRPYTGYTTDGIQYVVDLFNPANEFGVDYEGAGEPVVALLLREVEFGTVQQRLVENGTFFRILRGFADVLMPEYIRGTYSMFPIMLGYQEERIAREQRPWEFLYPLSLLAKPAETRGPEDQRLGRTTNDSLGLLWPVLSNPRAMEMPVGRLFSKIEVWDEERLLVQISKGVSAVLGDEFAKAARTLGMTAVQELVVE